MRVTIPRERPVSGSIEERWFDTTAFCTWVLFESDTEEPWAGVFGHSDWGGYDGAVLFGDERHAFIIAGGQGYIVDVLPRRLIKKTDVDHFTGAISIPIRPYVAAVSFADLYLVHESGELTHIGRIGHADLELEWADSNSVTGTCIFYDRPEGSIHNVRLSLDDLSIEIQKK